ncbi:LacI family transcriptional regulator [Prauserella shujinwangii]|uniref:LacI family transcriptional regulator n=1 Tax=Prauserella shujinwangii TaxID=1453103 RepID=A0A2T0LQY2_9PSEU|nr:LacI family DNA-binding transcriptional regulator [Prauserella shujinwangii]PRX45897.1 LacI family transcriptional regulator [Prauserella shujinwangii]
MAETTAVGARRATLATIAEAAGVSLPTVSKVLNGKDDVAASTRAKVLRLLEEHDYVPVGTRRPANETLVDLVFTALDSPWAVEIIRGVVESGLDAVVSSMANAPHRERWAESLVKARRGGALLVTSQLTANDRRTLERARMPLVVIDPVDLPSPDVPSVGATNWGGGLSATEHLLELGHRRIAMIGGPVGFLCSKARIDGYRSALERAGLAADPELIRHGDFHHEGGYVAALELLRMPEPPTAIFAGSDEQALGTIEAARMCGLAVPGDLSVVGFDDLPVARWSSPPLTTVRQPLAEMGRHAGRMLADLIAGKQPDSRRVELATQLTVRASTAPPRA